MLLGKESKGAELKNRELIVYLNKINEIFTKSR
ncbi:MAG: hypothetical protein ACD_28C00011G0003 [uncultured bacterium]|nr:MAG: hypothetical protein ACD_28C00011G0003 [uncultured bacterium]